MQKNVSTYLLLSRDLNAVVTFKMMQANFVASNVITKIMITKYCPLEQIAESMGI